MGSRDGPGSGASASAPLPVSAGDGAGAAASGAVGSAGLTAENRGGGVVAAHPDAHPKTASATVGAKARFKSAAFLRRSLVTSRPAVCAAMGPSVMGRPPPDPSTSHFALRTSHFALPGPMAWCDTFDLGLESQERRAAGLLPGGVWDQMRSTTGGATDGDGERLARLRASSETGALGMSRAGARCTATGAGVYFTAVGPTASGGSYPFMQGQSHPRSAARTPAAAGAQCPWSAALVMPEQPQGTKPAATSDTSRKPMVRGRLARRIHRQLRARGPVGQARTGDLAPPISAFELTPYWGPHGP